MNVAVNKQSAAIFFIIAANASAVGLQGNAIAADNSNLTLLACTVQQITFGSNVYVAGSTYFIDINHVVSVRSNSLNVNIAAVCAFCLKPQCLVNILLDYINIIIRFKACVVGNYRCVVNMVNAAAGAGNINLSHMDIAAEQDISVAGDSTGAGFIAYKLNTNRVVSL